MQKRNLQFWSEIFGHETLLQIEFDYSPGEPERGPSYSSGGEPATGPEIDISAVSILAHVEQNSLGELKRVNLPLALPVPEAIVGLAYEELLEYILEKEGSFADDDADVVADARNDARKDDR